MQEAIKRTEDYVRDYGELNELDEIKDTLADLLKRLDQAYIESKVSELDVDDLLEYAFLLLKSDQKIVDKVRERFKYIFVDEFQDTSFYQAEMLRLICEDERGSSLFVVGDLKQSIYQFRGADLKSYKSFEEWISKKGKVYPLTQNFRSSPQIVDYINKLFKRINDDSQCPNFPCENLKSTSQNDKMIHDPVRWINREPDHQESVDSLISFLQKIDPEDYSKYAVLFRTNRTMLEYEQKLSESQIPTYIVGAGNFFQRQEIKDIFRILNWLVSPHSKIKREEVLNTDWFQRDLCRLKSLEEKLIPKIPKLSIPQILEEIYKNEEVNIRGYCSFHGKKQMRANLEKLKELTRISFSDEKLQLVQYVDWLHNKILHDTEETNAEIGEHECAVILTTIHSAKGLEYENIIVVELDRSLDHEYHNPEVIYNRDSGIEFCFKLYTDPSVTKTSSNYKKTLDEYKKEYLEEEARILYVALTRAKQRIYLLEEPDSVPKRSKRKQTYQQWITEK